ncbi:MAG: lytic transglycosylase domain-containing protein [Verrucomicrobiota bacterium]|nr:lytic transglycosylase domain-containing protein [Verrucomicrobiota bacterium]
MLNCPLIRVVRIFRLIVLVLILGVAITGYWQYTKYRKSARYNSLVEEASFKYEVDPDLIRAVIWRETNFNTWAEGAAGERGLMQIMPVAFSEYAKAEKIESPKEQQLFDPRTNIMAGTWYLSRGLRRYSMASDPVPFALAEYNAGRKNVLKWRVNGDQTTPQEFVNAIDFPTTKKYVLTIMEKREKIKKFKYLAY